MKMHLWLEIKLLEEQWQNNYGEYRFIRENV